MQSKVYGDCILARYQDVERGMCEREFQVFKACVQVRVPAPPSRQLDQELTQAPSPRSVGPQTAMGRRW